jgi:CheY-like chemotaxis protein
VKLNGNVLVVDDDMGCGRLLALLIRHLGHGAAHVDSGGKALEYLASCPADLVILDVMMPEIDGVEVLRRMRADPRTENTPVVMFSALNDPQFCKKVREYGANDYWIKATLDFRALEQRLATYLPPVDPQAA